MNEGKGDNLNAFTDLRRRAERVAQQLVLSEGVGDLSVEAAHQQLCELRVRQIELELQHEDLLRAQSELEASRKRYFDLFNDAPFGYVALDDQEQIIEVNTSGARILGLCTEDLVGQLLTRFIASEDQDIYYLYRRQLLRDPDHKTCELRLIRNDGSRAWVRIETRLIPSENGLPKRGCLLVLLDITQSKQEEAIRLELAQQVRERALDLQDTNVRLVEEIAKSKKAVATLRESEEHFRGILEKLPVAFFCHNGSEIVFANMEAADLLQEASPKALAGISIVDYMHPESKQLFRERFDRAMEERCQQRFFAKMVSRQEAIVEVEVFLTPFTYQDDLVLQITAYNMTKRKRYEEEISKADKLELIRTIAGGIAHDFNNYLTVLLGNITLAMGNRHNPDKIEKHLLEMKSAILHTTILSNRLFTFAKGSKPVKDTVQITDLIVENSEFALAGSNVRCEWSFQEDLYEVEVDQGQITQVLYNIVINAAQAMPAGGSIFIKGQNVTLEKDREFESYVLRRGRYVKISITDQGPGIPHEHITKIFNPFFTTKEAGTGLGLAAAYAIATGHDGYIEASSEQGKGATFSIHIPATTKKASIAMVKDDSILGTGKILVIDDEDIVRKVLSDMLLHLGYTVHLAREGSEAIRTYVEAKQSGHPFDLVVMDLTIQGGLGGKDTIQRLLTLDPEVRAIVSSGYSNDPIMANFREHGFMGVVKKPYSVEKLSQAIHDAIAPKGRAT